MRRREFLMGAAVAAASASRVWGQMSDQERQAKLARISILTLNFASILKNPAQPNGSLDIMDIPDMFADRYGVHYVEVFSSHMLSTESAYFSQFKDRLKKAKSKLNQISCGGLQIVSMSSPDPVVRLETIDLTKRWIDHCVELGSPRLQVNQGTLAPDVLQEAIATLKAIADYGKSKKVFVTLEHRGSSGGDLVEVIKAAGAFANPDIGNFPDEATRHREIPRMFPLATGSCHVKYAPERWSLPDAMRAVKATGFNGIYALEGSGQDPYATTQRMIDALLPLM